MTHDPYATLRDEHPDITLAVLPLPAGQAWWLPDERGIVLDSRLDQAGRRSALEHELQHVMAGDESCDTTLPGVGRISLRRERAADLRASQRLITLDELAGALVWSLDYHEVAEYLHVSQRTARARILGLTDAEKAYIDARLATKEHIA